MIMTMMRRMRKMRIMRCLITSSNASFFSQANAQGSDSDLTAIALRKVFYGDDNSNILLIMFWFEHYYEGFRKVFYGDKSKIWLIMVLVEHDYEGFREVFCGDHKSKF